MQSDPRDLICIGMLIGSGLTVAGSLTILGLKMLYHKIKFELAYARHPRVVPYNHDKVCVEHCEWIWATLVMRDLPYGRYRICRKCGSINGNHDLMVSAEVLAQANEALANQQAKLAEQNRVDARVRDLTLAYSKLPTATVETVLQAQRDAVEKVTAELEAQEDAAKYDAWTTRTDGGNA